MSSSASAPPPTVSPPLLTAASLGAPPPPMAAKTKLMAATVDRGEICQQLKDLANKEDATTIVVALASSREATAAAMAFKIKGDQERPRSSTGAMDAKVLTAASPSTDSDLLKGELSNEHAASTMFCDLLKDTVLNKENAATTMMVVMVSKREDATKPSTASINPRLLSLASRGDCDGLTDYIFEHASCSTCHSISIVSSDEIERSSAAGTTMATQQKASGTAAKEESAEEEGARHPAPSAESPLDLEGVTIEGDTALHVLATCGDSRSYLRSAEIICSKAPHVLLLQNKKGGTPLHSAVRAGHSQMVSCLIDLANKPRTNLQVAARLKELLRKETALLPLHDAIRLGNKGIITKLLEFDPELASSPTDGTGTSPLYLAVMLHRVDIAKLLHQMCEENLSYSGPNAQNALHAAVLRDKAMTEMLLTWNKDLAEQVDENGSTPLHFAASLPPLQSGGVKMWMARTAVIKMWMARTPVIPVLLANQIQLYQQDSEGLYPIHVAASSGAVQTIEYFIKERPEIAGLRDFKGRTFLHIAVEVRGKPSGVGRRSIVWYALCTRSLARILNMQDNDGNTALHLAVQDGDDSIFCSLLRNREVNLNIPNNKGQTPLDVLWSNIPQGFKYLLNPEILMLEALTRCEASYGCRIDHFVEQTKEDEVSEMEKVLDSTGTLGILCVLIVTVTFGAIFAIPGGYKADDHYNGGTPALAGRHIFNAFIMVNTIAFILSSLATINLMFSGTSFVSLSLRRRHFNSSSFLVSGSVASLHATFALGMTLVLVPVAPKTTVVIWVMMVIAVLYIGYVTQQAKLRYRIESAVRARKQSRAN